MTQVVTIILTNELKLKTSYKMPVKFKCIEPTPETLKRLAIMEEQISPVSVKK